MSLPLWYRLALPVVAPVVSHWQRRRYRQLRDSAQMFENRMGYALEGSSGPVIWIHAASVGEVKSVRVLVQALLDQETEQNLLITVNTETALAEVNSWGHRRIVAQFAPLDTPVVLRRFLDHWRPVIFLNVEAEFWPLRFAKLMRADVPIFLINARLSKKMVARIRQLGFAPLLCNSVTHAFVQNGATSCGLQTLGLAEDRVSALGNLKSIMLPPTTALPKRDPLAMLAASTHDDEEAVVLDGFAKAQAANLGLTLTIAPRHPERVPDVSQRISAAGFQTAMASQGGVATSGAVLIEDRLGHMTEHYARAAICFVGGSLVNKGGHTPYEPGQFGCNLIAGPHTGNFQEEYQGLVRAGACAEVQDAASMAFAIGDLLERPRSPKTITDALPTVQDADWVLGQITQHILAPLENGK